MNSCTNDTTSTTTREPKVASLPLRKDDRMFDQMARPVAPLLERTKPMERVAHV